MPSSSPPNLVDKWLDWMKNRPVIAALVIAGTATVGLASVLKAYKEIGDIILAKPPSGVASKPPVTSDSISLESERDRLNSLQAAWSASAARGNTPTHRVLLQRKSISSVATIGELSVDGARLAVTLEHSAIAHPMEALPATTFLLERCFSQKSEETLICVRNTSRSDAKIIMGNTISDFKPGSIAVGATLDDKSKSVHGSRKAFDALMKLLGDDSVILLEIRDPSTASAK